MIEQRKRRENGEKGVTNTKRNERRKFWWNYFWRTSNKKSFCPVNLRNKDDWSDDLKSNFRLKWNSTLNQVVFLHVFVDTDVCFHLNCQYWPDLKFSSWPGPIVSVDWSVDKSTILVLTLIHGTLSEVCRGYMESTFWTTEILFSKMEVNEQVYEPGLHKIWERNVWNGATIFLILLPFKMLLDGSNLMLLDEF